MKYQKLITASKIFAIPVLYALILRFIFGIQGWESIFSLMSVTFLLCLPSIVGFLTVYLSKPEKASKTKYRIFAPWASILIFMAITLAFAIEGWACWIMVLPLFLLFASLGGLVGGYYNTKKHRPENKVYISLFVLLPLFIAPIESFIGAIPGTYQADTSIEITAPAESIWKNVTRVPEITKADDTGRLTNFLGFPRPLKAELNYNGVGAYRAASFTKGLTFHETVTKYTELDNMTFEIKANPYEIPSTTLDKHVVVGGKFFDVLTGTYELKKLGENNYRLILYSRFTLNTTFNFYASWWARWIMQDIQNNVLKIIKSRAEKDAKK